MAHPSSSSCVWVEKELDLEVSINVAEGKNSSEEGLWSQSPTGRNTYISTSTSFNHAAEATPLHKRSQALWQNLLS